MRSSRPIPCWLRRLGRVAVTLAVAGPVLSGGVILGQDVPITGVVLDASTGAPLQDALISRSGGQRPAVTGVDGYFEMYAPSGEEYVLMISRLGYRSSNRLYPAAIANEHIIVELEPDPIELEGLEVFVDALRERFVRRRNSTQGLVQAFEAADLIALEAHDGFDVFWKIVRMSRPCPTQPWEYCLIRWGVDVRISVCIDDRRAWGGVQQLADYRPEELYVVEVYGRGSLIKAYTKRWVESGYTMRQLPPDEWDCY